MKFSTRARYGARALIELAKHQGQGPLPLKQIAQCQHIPLKYLEQIAMVLKSAKLIKSIRGPSGGYTLGRPPDTIHLLEIIETLEGSLGFVNCVKDPSRATVSIPAPFTTYGSGSRWRRRTFCDRSRLPTWS